MPTAITTITPQTQAEVGACLTNLGIWCYSAGGKLKAGYQEFYQLCMAQLAGSTSITSPSVRRVTSKRTRSRGAVVAVPVTETTPRGRGRPRKTAIDTTTTRTRVRKTASDSVNPQTEAILKCVAAGFTSQTAMIPELKRNYGITIRPNHLGIALGRLARAGKLAKAGAGKNATWSPTATGQLMAQAA